ncbi:uncharacterized protein LOC107458276 [Arachis duranensis]|uniref:Uncharacterized protein LOC107458276 n=1 Tax=Arachis duranensis TaxID=130453 RepID=A0A6P5MH99_ARADU|nr:uncharacterized protein LOC107458276 [Arachis duranensis]
MGLVKWISVDTRADSNIMFRNVFDTLEFRETDLKTHQHGVVSLRDNFIKPGGVVTLPVSIRGGEGKRAKMVEFVVLRDSTAYNVILGRKTINEFSAGDLETAVACDNASLSLRKKSKEASGIVLADLDSRLDDKSRPEPEGDLEKVQSREHRGQIHLHKQELPPPNNLKKSLMEAIRAKGDLFAWTPTNMPGVDPDFMSHRLVVKPDAKPVAQRRRKMSQERVDKVAKQTASLLEARFFRKLEYSTWLSNVVLVKKANEKWRMCVDYSDLNKACPKDQIPMHKPDEIKTAFIMPGSTYCYRVMPFGLKNAGATYQRLMNRVFSDLIGKSVEVYVDVITQKGVEVKSSGWLVFTRISST